MPDPLNDDRRRFLGLAAAAIAGAQLLVASWSTTQASPSGENTFGVLKQVSAGLLDIGYAEAGPADGPPVILLHGWPYDIHSFVDVAPLLAAEGYRVIVRHLRGHGTTRFLSDDTVRNAQQSAIALDIVALMDATFERSAASFDNPDHVGIVIYNYRWRLSIAPGEPRYDELGRRLAEGLLIAVPTITLDGDSDGVAPASNGTACAKKFSGKRTHRIVKGIGHMPQEAPQAFAEAVIDVDAY